MSVCMNTCACTHMPITCTNLHIDTHFCPQLPSRLTTSCALQRSQSINLLGTHPEGWALSQTPGQSRSQGIPPQPIVYCILPSLPGFPSPLEAGEDCGPESQLQHGEAPGGHRRGPTSNPEKAHGGASQLFAINHPPRPPPHLHMSPALPMARSVISSPAVPLKALVCPHTCSQGSNLESLKLSALGHCQNPLSGFPQ